MISYSLIEVFCFNSQPDMFSYLELIFGTSGLVAHVMVLGNFDTNGGNHADPTPSVISNLWLVEIIRHLPSNWGVPCISA